MSAFLILLVQNRVLTLVGEYECYDSYFYPVTPILLKMIEDKSFLADLKSLCELKKSRLFYSKSLNKAGYASLKYLKQIYPEIEFSIDKMEIIGAATQYNDWTTGIPMKKISGETGSWEIEIELMGGGAIVGDIPSKLPAFKAPQFDFNIFSGCFFK